MLGGLDYRTLRALAKRGIDDFVFVTDPVYGARGDGVTDDSAAIQAAIDANKGKTIIIPNGTFIHAGILLDGSSYNDTQIYCYGELKLRARVGAEDNFGGAYVGLILKDCDNVGLHYRGHGNRANQPDAGDAHLVGIAGASNVRIPVFHIREIRGDGMYISQSSWTSNSTVPEDIHIGEFLAKNSADDGRNALSVISVNRLTVDSFKSIKVGGTVASTLMPGGLDIEPNQAYHTVDDVEIGNLYVVSGGNTGLAILGQPITSDVVGDWNMNRVTIGQAVVKLTGATGFPIIRRAFDVKANLKLTPTGTVKRGIDLNWLDRPHLNIVARGVDQGIVAGESADSWISDFLINVDIYGYAGQGLQAVGVRRGRFTGRIYGATSAVNTFAIRTRSSGRGITQTGVVYAIDAPYDGNNVRAFRNETGDTVAYDKTYAADCDWQGYSSFSVQCDASIPTRNIRGRNHVAQTSAPANGAWVAGDEVRNDSTNGGFVAGWKCIASGAPGTWQPINFVGAAQAVSLFDDFLGDVLADQWNGRVGSDPQCVTPGILANQLRGIARMTTGDDAAGTMAVNGVQIESALNWRAAQGGLVFEVRLSLSAITGVAVFVGLTDQAAALEIPFELAAGDALTSNATDAVGVLFDTNADTDNWWLVGVDSDVDAAKENSGVAPVAVTPETWRIEVSTAGVATFYRNGTQVGSAMVAAVTPGTGLTPVIAACSRGAASRSIDFDYLLVQNLR